MKLKRDWIYLSALAGVMSVATQAQAQSAGAPAAEEAPASTGGDIIVTAQRRAQRLADVGLTITAATGAQLTTAGVKDITDLPRIAPGVTTGYSYLGYAIFSVRGINFAAQQLSAAPSVSVYADEAILPYGAMTGGLLFDVERVEVIKGPQGTLFGQNATGGSINVVAAKPTSTPHAGFTAEVNHFGQVQFDAYASGPLSDTVRVRVAGQTTQFGAWQRGYFLSRGLKNGDANRAAGRAIFEWTPSDRTKVQLTVSGNYNHGEAQQSQLHEINPIVPAAAIPGLIGYPIPNDNRDVEISRGTDTHVRNRQYQAILRIDQDLTENLSVTSLTNYVDFKTRQMIDVDGTALNIDRINPVGSVKTFSQELRLNGKIPSANISYIVGGNYQNDKVVDIQHQLYDNLSSLPPGAQFDVTMRSPIKTYGVFGNVDWEVVPGLTITGGARYTKTQMRFAGCTYGNALAAGLAGFVSGLLRGATGQTPPPAGAFVPGGCLTMDDRTGTLPSFLPKVVELRNDQDNVSWRAGANYKIDPDNMIYALVSRGYKAGAYPNQISLLASLINFVKQEKLTSYEVGAKLSFLDRRLQFNIAGFYYDYVDKQLYTYLPAVTGAAAQFLNIPKSKAKGVEMELRASPVAGLTLSAAATYVKTEVGTFNGYDVNIRPVSFTGHPFNYAPEWTVTSDAMYEFPVGGGINAYVGGSLNYNSHTYADLSESPSSFLPARTLIDARIGINSDKGWRAGLWVRNITDKYYWNAVTFAGDTLIRFAGQPRTFGATFGVQF